MAPTAALPMASTLDSSPSAGDCRPEDSTTDTAAPAKGDPLRRRAERVERGIRRTLMALHAETVPHGAGPKRVADHLGLPVPMASRVLKALGTDTPLSALQRFPGPDPLRRWINAAARHGASRETRAAAVEAVDEFEQLISDEAGDRAALDARLLTWMPEARRTLELRRRQSVFRGLSEIEGRSCRLDSTVIILHPSQGGDHVDLCCVQVRTGMISMRPGVATKFVTERVAIGDGVRQPASLDDVDLDDATSGVRLDEFVQGTPADVEIIREGDRVQYLLRSPDSAQNGPVDFIIAELDRAEFELLDHAVDKGTFFSHLVQGPCHYGVLDVLFHRDIVPGRPPGLHLYRNLGETQAQPDDPLREVDRIEPLDAIQRIESDAADIRIVEFPRYGEMLAHIATRLDWDLTGATLFRARMDYPIPGTQISIGFREIRF